MTPFSTEIASQGEESMRIGLSTKSGLLIVLALHILTLLIPENIAAQEPDYRDPQVVQKELKEKLVIKGEYIAKYPADVRAYAERGEIYAGLCKLSRDDKERVDYADRAYADFAKAIEIDPNYYVTFLKRAEFRQ